MIHNGPCPFSLPITTTTKHFSHLAVVYCYLLIQILFNWNIHFNNTLFVMLIFYSNSHFVLKKEEIACELKALLSSSFSWTFLAENSAYVEKTLEHLILLFTHKHNVCIYVKRPQLSECTSTKGHCSFVTQYAFLYLGKKAVETEPMAYVYIRCYLRPNQVAKVQGGTYICS